MSGCVYKSCAHGMIIRSVSPFFLKQEMFEESNKRVTFQLLEISKYMHSYFFVSPIPKGNPSGTS